jgi:signal transduction histidine kinase
VQHLARLVDDLLDVSRITTGKITLRPTAVEVHAVVQAALESVRPLLTSKQHALALDPPPSRSGCRPTRPGWHR